jgi:hypothetical protein
MKTKKIMIIFACVLLACFALGAADVVKLADTSTSEENTNDKDRLIGVFVTTEHLDLFDIGGYFNDHANQILSGGEINEGESAEYEGRLYATLIEKPYTNEQTGKTTMTMEYVFEGVEGISYYCPLFSDEAGSYHGASGDEAISDGHTAINATDAGDSISLEGTIYVSTSGGPTAFYYNPVYQTAQGEVYAVSGQGMSYGGDITTGMSGSQELKAEMSTTTGDETETVSSKIKMAVCFMDAPTGVTVIQLNRESKVLAAHEYAPGTLPETLIVEPYTEYIVVETHTTGADRSEATMREVFQPGDDSLFAFYCRDDGICIKQYCGIKWND